MISCRAEGISSSICCRAVAAKPLRACCKNEINSRAVVGAARTGLLIPDCICLASATTWLASEWLACLACIKGNFATAKACTYQIICFVTPY